VGGEDLVVTYIRHLWSSKYGATRERELYESIKKRVTTKKQAIDFVEELASNARLYAAILNPAHEIWAKYGATARQHVETLNLLRMIQIRPLLLAVLDRFEVPEARKSLRAFVSWSVRFLITG